MKDNQPIKICSICGADIQLTKETHYIARDNGKTGLTSAFTQNDEEQLYDAFDCPNCGCQLIIQPRKRVYDLCEEEHETEHETEQDHSMIDDGR